MPLYDYKCSQCGKVTEVRHGFDHTHTDPCPACGGAVSRVFSAAPIVFKGSGFYLTDSRKSSGGGDAPKSDAPKTAEAPKAEAPKSDAAASSSDSAA